MARNVERNAASARSEGPSCAGCDPGGVRCATADIAGGFGDACVVESDVTSGSPLDAATDGYQCEPEQECAQQPKRDPYSPAVLRELRLRRANHGHRRAGG